MATTSEAVDSVIHMNNVNALKIYFGDPYPITDKITLRQPTVDDVIEDEFGFWGGVRSLTATSTAYRLELWRIGIDWNKVSNYEMFCACVSQMSPNVAKMFFCEDLDFSKFQVMTINGVQPDELVLPQGQTKPRVADKRNLKFRNFQKMHTFYDEQDDIEINAKAFHMISDVVAQMMHMYPKNEYAIGKTSKEFIIQGDQNLEKRNEIQMRNSKSSSSSIQPLISMCVNHPGFKYNIEQTRKLKIAQFMDCARRLQVYESTHALWIGSNSGFVDTSKIPRESFDFSRVIKQ